MKIAIDSDINGIQLKEFLINSFKEENIIITNLNYLSDHKEEDYPDIAYSMAKKILSHEYDRGILICGTGLGMSICANKIKGIYAGACNDVYAAERLIKSNNGNILTLGAYVTGRESAKSITKVFLESEYAGGRSLPKVNRMREIENMLFK